MSSRDLSLGILFTSKIDDSLNRIVGQLNDSLNKVNQSVQKVTKSTEEGRRGWITYDWSLKNIITDMERLLAVQLRWYGAKAVLFAAWEAPISVLKEGLKYIIEIDKSVALLDRYAAMEGKLGAEARKTSKEIVDMARNITLHLGVTFENIIKSADRLAAAGIGIDTVKASLQDFAKLELAFPEIEMEKFTTAIVGFLNSFRNTEGMARFATDSEKIAAILDKAVVALGKAVLEPKNLTSIIQYLGQVGSVAGFSTDQLLAMAAMITNLGSKANVSARALRGFLLGLNTKQAREGLAALGIELNRTQTIAQQFDKIMTGLQKAVGTGQLTVGAQAALSKIASTERITPLLGLIREWGNYKKLVEDIEGSEGALDRVAERMNDTLQAKMQIMKNLKKETGAAALENENFGKVMDGIIFLVRQGALAVNDLAAAFSILGESIVVSAKIAWQGIKALGNIAGGFERGGRAGLTYNFGRVKEELKETEKGVGDLLGNFEIKVNNIIKQWAEFDKRIKGVPKNLKGTDIKSMLGLGETDKPGPTPVDTEKAKERYKSYLADLRSAERSAASARLEQIRNDFATEDRLLENAYKNRIISEEEYQEKKKALMEKEQSLFQSEMFEKLASLQETYDEEYKQIGKIVDAKERERRLKVLQAREEADSEKWMTEWIKNENKLKTEADDAFYKNRSQWIDRIIEKATTEANLSKLIREGEINSIKNRLEAEEDLANFQFDRKEITSKEYYEGQIRRETELLNKKKELLDQELLSFYVLSQDKMNKAGSNVEEQERIENDFVEKKEQIRQRELELEGDYANKVVEIHRKLKTDLEEIYRTEGLFGVVKEGLRQWLAEAKTMAEGVVDLVKGTSDTLASSFSSLLGSMMKGNFNINKESDINKAEDTLRNIELQKQELELQKQKIQSNDKLTESEKKVQLAAIESQEKQLEASRQIVEAQKKVAEGQTSLLDIFRQFLEKLIDMMVQFIASEVVKTFLTYLINIFGSSYTGGGSGYNWGSGGGYSPVTHAGGVGGESKVYRRIGLEDMLPVHHSGVGPDEELVIKRRNEGIFTPGQMEALGQRDVNVLINVENKSSQPVNAKQSRTQFDGRKYIINVILEDINRGGPLRGAIANG